MKLNMEGEAELHLKTDWKAELKMNTNWRAELQPTVGSSALAPPEAVEAKFRSAWVSWE